MPVHKVFKGPSALNRSQHLESSLRPVLVVVVSGSTDLYR